VSYPRTRCTTSMNKFVIVNLGDILQFWALESGHEIPY